MKSYSLLIVTKTLYKTLEKNINAIYTLKEPKCKTE